MLASGTDMHARGLSDADQPLNDAGKMRRDIKGK
jgi:hypothetical protein